MEKIQQALERARKERSRLQQGSLPTPVRRSGKVVPISEFDGEEIHPIVLDKRFLDRHRVLYGSTDESAENAYKLLRTRVLHRMACRGWRTLGVTSPNADEGKSLTAVNLAITLAREVTHSVLLVDADLRHPSVHRTLGFTPEYGLADYLVKGVNLGSILLNPGHPRLVLLPGLQTAHNSSELLSSPKMENLVKEMQAQYSSRIIVFDLPPLLVSDDALAFAPHIDGFLLVIEEGKTSKGSLTRSLELLSPEKVLGTVLNKGRNTANGYGAS